MKFVKANEQSDGDSQMDKQTSCRQKKPFLEAQYSVLPKNKQTMLESIELAPWSGIAQQDLLFVIKYLYPAIVNHCCNIIQ